MTQEEKPSHVNCDHATLDEVMRALTFLMPDLTRFWALPLKHYAYTVYDTVIRGDGSVRKDAMVRLQRCIVRAALRSGASDEDVERVSHQIAQSPIIQTGPHCHLLVEPDAFYTHLFSALGLAAHGLRWHIWYSASTVKFIERAKKGPGWLSLNGNAVNVFGLPRRRMDSYSICGQNGPYRFELAAQKGDEATNALASQLKAILPDRAFPSAAEAIKTANQILWRSSFPPSIRLLQVDDLDVADLVADHLEDSGSWLSARLNEHDPFANNIMRTMDHLNAGAWAGWVRPTTDFFWGLQDGRIFPLHLERGVCSGGPSSTFKVRFEPEHLAAALRERKLVPNLLTTFLITSILPGTRVLGGCRQTVYYPLMRYLVATALQFSGDWQLLDTMRADKCLGAWGHRVLRPTVGDPLLEIEKHGSVMQIAAQYSARTLKDCAGDMASFTKDPIWAQMSAHIRDQAVNLQSAEWQWV
ncbi:hypothetical protein GOZ94_26605 [Agrobacterium vitis]|uniref:hypothetical protein n=1 Tax=Agrobacterium vitis TaxID=373 RepID=UPI0012E853C4|nr:hypothetical protein [Agrobacterium vitis]MVA22494.1 hypothetical protein [Agrobacterium vitis]